MWSSWVSCFLINALPLHLALIRAARILTFPILPLRGLNQVTEYPRPLILALRT